jgi:hypothetical protein
MYSVDGELGSYWVIEYADGTDTDHIDEDMANALRANMELADDGIVELRCLSGATKIIRMKDLRSVFFSTPAIREQYRITQYLLDKEYKKFKLDNAILED